jgi:hypothetical protein
MRPPRGGALEQVPVQPLGHGDFRFGRRSVPRPAKLDHRVGDLPELTFLNDLRGLLEMRAGTLLRAELDDTIGALVGPQRFDGTFDGIGERLLHVHVLAGRDRLDQHLAMPVIGRRDVHRVHVLAVEDAPVVFIALELHVFLQLRQLLQPLLEPRGIGVTPGDVLHVGVVADEQGSHRASTAARSDQADTDPVVRAIRTLRASATRDCDRPCRGCGKVEESATGERVGRLGHFEGLFAVSFQLPVAS